MSKGIAAISLLLFLLISPAFAAHSPELATRFFCTTEEAALEALELRIADDFETLREKTQSSRDFKCFWASSPIYPITDYSIVHRFKDPWNEGEITYLLSGKLGDQPVWMFARSQFMDQVLHLSGA